MKNAYIFIFLLLSLLWSLSIFISPLTLQNGTVTNLDGRANWLDYEWSSLPIYQRLVYLIGDMICHQKWYRSFQVNGNQLPVCARDTSIFIFINLGIISAFFFRVEKFMKKFLILLILFLPLLIDWSLQSFTPYESTNLIRFLTGAPAGFILGFLLAGLLRS